MPVGPVDFRPFTLEVAWDYCKTVLSSEHQQGMIMQTIGALAIEIVLKSFNANVSGNAGQLNETYEFNRIALPRGSDPHSLKDLASILRSDIRSYLLDELDAETISENDLTFKISRYSYERSAPLWSSDSALKLAVSLIFKSIYLYKQRGCTDPFVLGFNIDAVYFRYVQRFIVVESRNA